VVLLLLLMASLLVAGWASRNLLTEQRIAAGELRRIGAFEAAEAGLAWGQAMLDSAHPVGSDCRAQPGGAHFVARYLGTPDVRGRFVPRQDPAAAGGVPLQMLCARAAGGWRCHCPAAGPPQLTPEPGGATTPAYLLRFEAGDTPGTVQLVATGCDHLARPCLAGSGDVAGASTRLRLGLALLPALATPPAAPLTTLGTVDAGAAALGLHNADAQSGGLAVHAGGAVLGSALRVQTAPGGYPAHAVLGGDAALAALTAEQLFQRHVGSNRADWLQQPGVHRLDCTGDCGPALQALLATRAGLTRIHVPGPLQLAGALQLGSPARPLQLVVDGDLLLRGPVQLHGLVHAHRLRWDAVSVGDGGLLRGAALLSQGYHGDGAPDIVYDAALLQRLRRQHGSWLRIPGSWRDF
jgi:hypothetical protein